MAKSTTQISPGESERLGYNFQRNLLLPSGFENWELNGVPCLLFIQYLNFSVTSTMNKISRNSVIVPLLCAQPRGALSSKNWRTNTHRGDGDQLGFISVCQLDTNMGEGQIWIGESPTFRCSLCKMFSFPHHGSKSESFHSNHGI